MLQSNVFGIFEGLGTPTHTKVVGYLNASKMPDVFVASGCPCWDNGTSQPYTFGWQPNYTIEGKILGQYIKQHFAGQKIGVLYQDDDFGQGGLKGIQDELPARTSSPSRPTSPDDRPRSADHGDRVVQGQVHVDFTVPIFTAIAQLTAFKIGYKPQLVVSNVGIDPTTVGGSAEDDSRRARPSTALIEGAITDGYLPSTADTSNPWIALFKKVHDQYDASAPCDGNVDVRHGERLHPGAGAPGGRQEPDPPGTDRRDQQARRAAGWARASVPFRYSTSDHGGYGGVETRQVTYGNIVLHGRPLTTTPASGSAITPYTGTQPAPPANGIPTG